MAMLINPEKDMVMNKFGGKPTIKSEKLTIDRLPASYADRLKSGGDSPPKDDGNNKHINVRKTPRSR